MPEYQLKEFGMDQFHTGILKIDAHDTVDVVATLGLTTRDVSIMRSVENVEEDGPVHLVRFYDRNSDLLTRRDFRLAVSVVGDGRSG